MNRTGGVPSEITGVRGKVAMFQLAGSHMRGIGVLMLVALVLAYVAGVLGGSGNVDANGELIGCDFVAFYGAGADVLAGRHDLLYDLDHQRETHQAISQNAGWDYYYPYVNRSEEHTSELQSH